MKEIEEIEVFDIKDFRKWLKKNHLSKKKVRIVLHKKHTGKKSPGYQDQLDEAICFGWIDTTVRRLDEDRYMRDFSKRNKDSKWSDNTLSYGKRLLEAGRLMPEGLKYYQLGLSKPTHDFGIPKNPDMPLELKKGLVEKGLKREFDKQSPSKKKMLYRWILRAKRKETREKRVNETIESVRGGREIF
jgi:uncharacterized protein YdeI (YjbR/CyaY-like superfamily)